MLFYYIVYNAGGSKSAYPHLFYFVIIFAAFSNDIKITIFISALASTIMSKYIMPQDVLTGSIQSDFGWIFRACMYFSVGLVVYYGVKKNKTINDELVQINLNLESIVKRKTDELEATFSELQLEQKKRLDSEHLKSALNFAFQMSHELNTPIGNTITITSHVQNKNNELKQFFENGTIKKSDFSDYLNIVTESCDLISSNMYKAAKFINVIKSKVDFTGNVLNYNLENHFNSIKSVDYIIDIFKMEINYLNIDVVKMIDFDDLKWCSENEFTKIIYILMSNCIEHAFINSENNKNTITIIYKTDENSSYFEVTDNGLGIDPKIQEHLFDPLYKVDLSNRKVNMGLYCIKRIAENYEGTVSCDSSADIGTKFIIKLNKPKGNETN